MKAALVFSIGFLGQILFSARMIVQWIHSERARKVTSPVLFWELSLIGSLVFMLYGILRYDLVIMTGQFISYGVYVRNLQLKNILPALPGWMKLLIILGPLSILLLLFHDWTKFQAGTHNAVNSFLFLWGLAGQFVFTFRFIYQWYRAEQVKQSILPTGFWIISLAGALMILIYGIIRKDFVLILSQSAGSIVYIRNLMLLYSSRKNKNLEEKPETIL